MNLILVGFINISLFGIFVLIRKRCFFRVGVFFLSGWFDRVFRGFRMVLEEGLIFSWRLFFCISVGSIFLFVVVRWFYICWCWEFGCIFNVFEFLFRFLKIRMMLSVLDRGLWWELNIEVIWYVGIIGGKVKDEIDCVFCWILNFSEIGRSYLEIYFEMLWIIYYRKVIVVL